MKRRSYSVIPPKIWSGRISEVFGPICNNDWLVCQINLCCNSLFADKWYDILKYYEHSAFPSCAYSVLHMHFLGTDRLPVAVLWGTGAVQRTEYTLSSHFGQCIHSAERSDNMHWRSIDGDILSYSLWRRCLCSHCRGSATTYPRCESDLGGKINLGPLLFDSLSDYYLRIAPNRALQIIVLSPRRLKETLKEPSWSVLIPSWS